MNKEEILIAIKVLNYKMSTLSRKFRKDDSGWTNEVAYVKWAKLKDARNLLRRQLFMNWRDTIEDPQVGEIYFDGISEKMYMFKSLGDYPPEWINITPELDDTNKFRQTSKTLESCNKKR